MILFIGLILCAQVQAQVNKRVKIVLNDGMIFKGVLIESFNENALKLSIDTSNIILIGYDRIKSINFANYRKIKSNFEKHVSEHSFLERSPFYHELRVGMLVGEETSSFTAQTINGYQLNKYLGAGVGVGLNTYGNYRTIPVYISAKGYLFDKKVSPYYFGDVGYGFAWKTNKNENMFEVENMKGGVYWQLGLGYQVNFYNSAIVFTLGYLNQLSKIDYTYSGGWDVSEVEVSEKRNLRRVALSIGFLL